jgi:hypothetical protein
MKKNTLDYFSVLVIGENPDEIMSNFDEMLELKEPYVLYQHKNKNIYRKQKIDYYKQFLKTFDGSASKNIIITKINELKKMSDEQYYNSLGETYDFDKDNNIITIDNPNGRWITCEKGGRIFYDKLKDKTGKNIVEGKVCEIDWLKIHREQSLVELYSKTWDLCVNKLEPKTGEDNIILNNMKPHIDMFKNFVGGKEQYVNYNTSFWTNAIVINNEWFDMENKDYSDWIINFYDKNILSLSENELVTIYECTK